MTKVENIDELVRICEQKKQTGDFQTLSKILNTTTEAARMRYYRKDEDAVKAMYSIIENRDVFIGKFKKE